MSGLLDLLVDPEVQGAVGRFFRRRPILAAVVGGFAGAVAYAAITHRPDPDEIKARGALLRAAMPPPASLRRIPFIPPTPAAVAAHERAVRVWAYQLGQGAAPADVPAHLAADVERYVAAGGRERHGNAESAFPFDW